MVPTAREKKANRPRYWVAYLLKDLPVGATFKPHLLHLTIIPWFVTELAEKEVVDSFYESFSTEKPFEITISEVDEFKHKRKILVNLIHSSPEARHLHQETLKWFDGLGARWAVQNPHVGPEYIPHIRRRQGYNLLEGQKIRIASLSLITATRRGDELRTVAAKVNFDEKA